MAVFFIFMGLCIYTLFQFLDDNSNALDFDLVHSKQLAFNSDPTTLITLDLL